MDYERKTWRVVDPIIGSATPLFEYNSSTWGPPEVDQILSPEGGWHNPKSTE